MSLVGRADILTITSLEIKKGTFCFSEPCTLKPILIISLCRKDDLQPCTNNKEETMITETTSIMLSI